MLTVRSNGDMSVGEWVTWVLSLIVGGETIGRNPTRTLWVGTAVPFPTINRAVRPYRFQIGCDATLRKPDV